MCLHITAQVKGIVGCCLGIFTLEGVAIERMEAAEDGEPSLVVNTGDGLFLDTVALADARFVSSPPMLSCTPLRAAMAADPEGGFVSVVLECGTGLRRFAPLIPSASAADVLPEYVSCRCLLPGLD